MLFFATTLIMATPNSSMLKELGLRPHGKNLWEWFWNYNNLSGGAKNNKGGGPTGIPGYDPILGSFDPSSRTAFHFATIMGLWGIILQIGSRFLSFFSTSSSTSTTSVCEEFQDVLPSGLMAIGLYMFVVCFVINYLLPGVSKPGGPRPAKIQRIPKWKDGRTTLSEEELIGWTFLTAEESHEATSKQFNSSTLLTGEAAGRQTWFKQLQQQEGQKGTPDRKDENDSGGGGVGNFLANLLSPGKKNWRIRNNKIKLNHRRIGCTDHGARGTESARV